MVEPQPGLLRQMRVNELDRRTAQQETPERFGRLALSDVFTMFGAPTQSDSPLNVVPAPLLALPAIAEIGLNLGEAGIESAANFLGADVELPRFDMFSNLLADNRLQALEAAGTSEPKTTAENLASVATAFIPGPGITKVATGLGKVQQTVASLLLPLVQSRSKLGVAAEISAGFFPVELINEAVDPEFESALFEGLFDDEPAPGEVSSVADAPATNMALAVAPPNVSIEVPEDAFDPDGLLPFNEEAQAEQFGMSAALAAAMVGSIFAIKRGRTRGLREVPTLTGKKEGFEQVTPTHVVLAEQAANRLAPLESIIRRAAPKKLQEFTDLMFGGVTPTAVQSKVKAALFGTLPNTHVNIPSLVIHLSTLPKMKIAQVEQYSDALTALDRLDDLNLAGTSLWEGAVRNIPRAELDQTVALARTDPLVSKMLDEAHRMMRGVNEFEFDAGMITRDEFEFRRDKRANYVPQSFDFDVKKRGRLGEILNKVINLTNDQPVNKSIPDSVKKRTGQVGADEGIPPFMLLEQRIANSVHRVEANRVRKAFFETLEGTQLGNKIIKEIKTSNKFTISFLDKGVTRHMQVGDDAIRRSLEFAPRQVAGILNSARQFTSMFLTRQGNPLFVPIAWGYELSILPLLRNPGRNLGVGDELLQRAGLPTISQAGDRAANLFSDPTVLLSPGLGTARTVWSNMMLGIWRNMETSLRVQGTIAQALGPKLTKDLARRGAEAYQNSFVHMADQFGTGNAVYASNRLSEDLPTQLNKLAPAYVAAAEGAGLTTRVMTRGLNMYTHALSQMHNVNRLMHFAANVTPSTRETLALVRKSGRLPRSKKGRQEFNDALKQARGAAAETRRAGIDPGQVGANVGLQRATSALRFADIAIQSTTELLRTMRKHPVRTSTAIMGTLTAFASAQYVSFRNNPRGSDHYYNQLTAIQRASGIYFYKEGTDEVYFVFPIDHLLRPMWSPFTEMLGSASGIRSGIAPLDAEQELMQEGIFDFFSSADFDNEMAENIEDGVSNALLQLLPADVPAVLGAPIAAFTGKTANVGRSGDFLRDIRKSQIDPDKSGATVDSVVSANVQAAIGDIIGTAMRPTIDTLDAFNREFGGSEDFTDALDAGMETFLARNVDRTRFAPSMLGMRQRILTSDTASRLYAEKKEGMQDIVQRAGKQFGQGGLPSGIIEDNATGTALGVVLSVLQSTQSNIVADIDKKISRLFLELEDVRRNPDFASSPAKLRGIENDFASEIKGLRMNAIDRLSDEEAAMTARLRALGWEGTFKFDDFDDTQAAELIKIPFQME